MKNRSFYLLCLICVAFSGALPAQSKLFVKIGYGSGALIQYRNENEGGFTGDPIKYGPGIGIQYRSKSLRKMSFYGDAGLLWHKFYFSDTYGGLGGGVWLRGNFNFIHGYVVLGGAIHIQRHFILRLGVGPMFQVHAKTDAIEEGYGQFASSSSRAKIEDYFRKSLLAADLGIEIPFRHFSLDLSLKQEIGTYFAKQSTHSSFQPQLASWRVAVLCPIWHRRASVKK